MTREYIPSLGPKLVAYYEGLARTDPGRWANHLAIAREFDAVAHGRPSEFDGRTLLDRLRALGSDRGSALEELETALELLSNRPFL